MESPMPPLPSKKAVALDLLERTSVFVHLDPRRDGVVVPQVFLKQPQLVLQIGLNMAIPILDLEVEDWGICCTLSFSRRPQFCRLPWSAIYALIGQEGGGMVWPEDVPPEVVAQQKAGAKKEAPRKPALRAIDSSSSDSADRQGEELRDGPLTQRSQTPFPKAEPARKEPVRLTPVPRPQLVPLETQSEATSEAGAEAEARPDSSAQQAELATREDAEAAQPGKRARPPYLRLVR